MWVANEIRKLSKGGVKLSNIALLYRDNADAEIFGRAMKAVSLPSVIYSDTDLLAEEEIEKFVTVLKAAHEPSDKNIAKAILLDYFNLPHIEVFEAIQSARKNRVAVASWIESSSSK